LIDWLGQLRKPDEEVAGRLVAPAKFVHALRCFLHYQTRRDQNLLSFDAQEALTTQPYLPFREPADLMREYFRNARVIFKEARRALDLSERSESSLATQFQDWRSRLSNSEFTVSGERIYLRSPGQLTADPAIFLRLLEFIARHGIPLSAETERRVEQAGESFRRILRARAGVVARAAQHPLASARGHALRVMHDTGLLQAMFPEWRHLLPGCSGLLSSLYRRRAHARHHRKAGRTGGEQRSHRAALGRHSLRG
jgi:[protein-PII] uridylyltransferase